MGIPPEVKQIVEKQIDVMVEQTKAYLPFIKLAFPGMKDLSEACYVLIVGNVLPVFVTQYAMRMKYPQEQDFIEFGEIAQKYKEKVKAMFQ